MAGPFVADRPSHSDNFKGVVTMSADNSTHPSNPNKPERPEGSPLFWHATGRWAKKILGKLHYFGRGSHDDALAEYERRKDDLHAGRVPHEDADTLTVYRLCAKFLTAKKLQRDGGELSPRTFLDYGALCNRLTKVFGKHRPVADLRPDDFAKLRQSMARTWGPVRLASEIVRSRTPFNWAWKSGLLEKPINYGEGFKRPSRKTLRQAKAARGPMMFSADELRRMLKAAGQPLKAMILLGVNAGLGNADVGAVPIKAIDLAGGWLNFARVKTGIARRVPLWPETVEAVKEWLAVRPAPKSEAHADILFTTVRGDSWGSGPNDRPLSHEMRKLLDALGINGHRNFYCLRHCTQTIGDECGDFLAVRSIMGHASADIADVYRERMRDERLRRVADHVRGWLFGTEPKKARAPRRKSKPDLRIVG